MEKLFKRTSFFRHSRHSPASYTSRRAS